MVCQCNTINWYIHEKIQIEAVCCYSCNSLLPTNEWTNVFELSPGVDYIVYGQNSPPPINKVYSNNYSWGFAIEPDSTELYKIYQTRTSTFGKLDYTPDELRSFIVEKAAGKIIVIRNDKNKPVGFALVFNMGIWGFIDIFVVNNSDRHRGIGKLLFKAVENYGKLQGWRLLECLHDPSKVEISKFLTNMGLKNITPLTFNYKGIN